MIRSASFLQSLKQFCFSILFPSFCEGCRREVSSTGSICPLCWSSLRFLEKPWCQVTGVPFSLDMGEGSVSLEALAQPPVFHRLRSAVVYSGIARDMVHALKYHDRTYLAPWMAFWLLRAGRELIDDTDAIIPVPLHRYRFCRRRFNQSAELARPLASLSKKPFYSNAIKRIRNTRQQTHLDAKSREKNLRDAFKLSSKARGFIEGKNLLLIDDVFTTGATVSSISSLLYASGARRVDVLTFARVLPKGHFMNKPSS